MADMNVLRFDPEVHLADMTQWYEIRGRPAPGLCSLPVYGYVVPGLAAGFLYLTDSDIAFADGLVTNPNAPIFDRTNALDAISDEIIATAKRLGVSKLLGFVSKRGSQYLCRNHGLKRGAWYMLMAMDLTTKE